MQTTVPAALLRATELTRAGHLAEATRLIQATLLGSRGSAPNDAGREPAPTPSDLVRLPNPSAVASGDRTGVIGSATAASQPDPRPVRPIGDTLRSLARARRFFDRLPGGAPTGTAPEIPRGAQFLDRHFASPEGGRPYRVYVPASLEGRPRGLVMMLHGCKQNPNDFAVGTRMNEKAEGAGLVVVYPEQTRHANAMACWNWFKPGDQVRGMGEPAILAGLAQAVVSEFDVPRDRVFVAGLSAGGAMAAILAEAYPDVFAAGGIHSGLPAGSASDVPSAFAAMSGRRDDARRGPAAEDRGRARLIVFHGTEDRTVHPVNGEAIAMNRLAADPPASRSRVTGADGRDYTRVVQPGPDGVPHLEHWTVHGAGHAWFGGDGAGSFTDPKGPDASAEMVRFFLAQAHGGRSRRTGAQSDR